MQWLSIDQAVHQHLAGFTIDIADQATKANTGIIQGFMQTIFLVAQLFDLLIPSGVSSLSCS